MALGTATTLKEENIMFCGSYFDIFDQVCSAVFHSQHDKEREELFM